MNGWHGSLAEQCTQQALLTCMQRNDCVITVQLQSKMHGWNEWLAALLAEHAHMQQRTAVVLQHAADYYYMITVQLQSKMHSWNEWLAWLCLLSNASQQRTAVSTLHTQQIIVHDNCTATIKDARLE
jgi:hypothetical protein